MTVITTNLVGRGVELSRLRQLVTPPYAESRVLLLLGDPGMGKTVLLAETARKAKAAGLVYTPVDGDQPSLLMQLVVWARVLGSGAGGGFPQWNCRCPQ